MNMKKIILSLLFPLAIITTIAVNADTASNTANYSIIRTSGHIEIGGSTAPATPSTGFTRVYALTSNGVTRLVQKGDSGLELVFFRDLVQRIRNSSGGTLTIGQAVYVNGGTGTTPNVTKAKADSQSTAGILGLVLSSSITANSFGTVQTSGVIGGVGSGVDTSAFSQGDTLYLSAATAGALTNTPPSSPNFWMQVGFVLVSHATNGQIYLQVQPFHGDISSEQIPSSFTTTTISTTDLSSTGTTTINNLVVTGTAIGVGPTTQTDVTASRACGTVYQNLTGKPMWVGFTGYRSSAGSPAFVGYTDAANPPTTVVAQVAPTATGFDIFLGFWVLTNNYYKIILTSGTPVITNWTEWY